MDHIEKIKYLDTDFIFGIGLSQLISKEIINSEREYAVGLHPTKLLKYRGRAAIPWLILLGEKNRLLYYLKLMKEWIVEI